MWPTVTSLIVNQAWCMSFLASLKALYCLWIWALFYFIGNFNKLICISWIILLVASNSWVELSEATPFQIFFYMLCWWVVVNKLCKYFKGQCCCESRFNLKLGLIHPSIFDSQLSVDTQEWDSIERSFRKRNN